MNLNKEEIMTEEALKRKLIKTFESLKKITLNKRTRTKNLHFNDIKQIALCIKTSKAYSTQFTQKYWYTLTPNEKSFLDRYKKSYVFLGCLDNRDIAYLIPFHNNKQHFLNCNITQKDWHIRINHRLYWYFPTKPDINLSKFEQALYSHTDQKMQTPDKKAYDKGWHKRNSECLKALKKLKEKHDSLSEEINELIQKLQNGQKI